MRAVGTSHETVVERGMVPTEARLGAEGRFIMLLFRPPVLHPDSIDDTLAVLRALPGQVSVLVRGDSADRAAIAPHAPLAVGSTFKLAVLAALVDEIAAKKHSWKDVVELQSRWRSLPPGVLQTWPEGSPVTLGSLAILMISQSDNTATDALVDIVGRAAVERHAPRNRPLLTTREFVVLKAPGNESLLARFRAEDEAARRELLSEVAARPLPPADIFVGAAPRALDVEWRFSARELCDLMAKVARLPLMSINPGAATEADWDRVAYKGGSEPGVLNLTTLVEAKGKRHCVVATWNAEEPLDETRLLNLYTQLLAALRAER
ncbi:hypothetical protein BE11_31410 [Sorangium cellulosum]|nr:hypothetical protein BE11_31410 [Sorangium cellulosum]